MELPQKTLLNLIETNWTLTQETLTAADIVWTRIDWHLEKSTFSPHVITKLAGFRRLQDAEPNLYEFDLIVQVVLWADAVSKMEAKQEDHWKLVEQIKKLIENAALPTSWQYKHVDAGTDTSVLEVLPNIFTANILVKAGIAWSGD